jgi:hypothetical protein
MNCSNKGNWTIVTLKTLSFNNPTIFDNSQHNFALDSQGRPRFMYYDDAVNHAGTYYAFCDADCTNIQNWFEVQLSGSFFDQLALTFTRSDQPRLAALTYPNPGPTTGMLSYFECNTNCLDPVNWLGTTLYERGGGQASWVLHLDSNNHPRMVFYQGVPDSGPGEQLNYLWCNTSCTSAASWTGANVGLAQGEGTDPDLTLNSQNQPRIAYHKGAGGLGFGACNANCESTSANWQHQVTEASSVLDTDWPRSPPPNCTVALWHAGYRPSLSLDRAGNPSIGYSGEHQYSGGSCTPGEDFRAVRFLVSSSESQTYLPLIIR